MMCARLLKPVKPEQQGRFYRASERVFTRMHDLYARTLAVSLRHSVLVWLVLLATIGLNVWLYTIVPKGFFPQQDTGRLIGFIRADQATSFQAMRPKLDNLSKSKQMRTLSAGSSVASAIVSSIVMNLPRCSSRYAGGSRMSGRSARCGPAGQSRCRSSRPRCRCWHRSSLWPITPPDRSPLNG